MTEVKRRPLAEVLKERMGETANLEKENLRVVRKVNWFDGFFWGVLWSLFAWMVLELFIAWLS